MKINIILLSIGVLGSVLYTQVKVQSSGDAETIQVEGINQNELKRLKDLVAESEANQEPQSKLTRKVMGLDDFQGKVDDVIFTLKANQILFRFDFQNAMKPLLDRAMNLAPTEVNSFNDELGKTLTKIQRSFETVKTEGFDKTEVLEKIENLKNSVRLSETVVSTHSKPRDNAQFVKDISEALENLNEVKKVSVEASTSQYPHPLYMAAMWMILFSAAFAVSLKTKVIKSKSINEEDDKINPTLKRVLMDLEFPLFLVDSNLEVIWKNKSSDSLDLAVRNIQEILSGRDSTEAVKLNGRDYKITISELVYKSGKVNHLIQCRPEIVASRHLDHLLDTSEITSYLDGVVSTTNTAFGDVNQTTAQVAVKLGYLFKVSGKFLDVDFKKDLSDCFIERARLEQIIKEFVMSCHHMIKDQSESEGIYLRTDEAGNKYSVSCFLANYKVDSLDTNLLAREFLRRFTILEARYASCHPSVDFRIVNNEAVKGLDISVHFENQSELESIMSNVSASV